MTDALRQNQPLDAASSATEPVAMVVGITSPQTCLVLGGRLRALREAGFAVTLVAAPGELLQRTAAREGVQAMAIPIERGIAPLSDLLSLFRLWRLLLRLRPRLVEFSTPKAGLLGTLAARLAGVSVRVYFLRGLRLETASGWRRRLLLYAERVAAASARVVLCNSATLRERAIELGLAPAGKLLLLGKGSSNGVDVDRFSPGLTWVREKLAIPASAPVVGFVGRLTRDKGIPELLEAFDTILEKQPEAHLLLVGWYDASEDALDLTSRARIEAHPRIHLSGYVADTAPYYRAMEVLVLPSWREGFPNVVLEAGATAVPVVTTLSTGSRDAVLPEVTGLLVPPGYPQAISEAVLRLLGDAPLRRRMGEAARRWIFEHFINARVLGLITELYLSLLEKSQTKSSPLESARPGVDPKTTRSI